MMEFRRSPISRIGRLAFAAAARAAEHLRDLSPVGRSAARLRGEAERRFDALARGSSNAFSGKILVDGTFDNPNLWFRYALMRAGLGLAGGREIGLLGPYRRRYVRRTFANQGIAETRDLAAAPVDAARAASIAAALLARTKTADDVIAWDLPGGVDPVIVYDAILKRQRLAKVDPAARDFPELVHEAITRILRVLEILDSERPDLVVMSHTVGMICGPLAYLAAARGIPVLLAFGHFGALRFTRFAAKEQIFSFYDRPTGAEIEALPAGQAAKLAEIGRTYLTRRFDGKADDLASLYAFRRSESALDRASICREMGWAVDRPIVAVYAANWFDWPHQLGMTEFRDFHDWISATLDAARAAPGFNWLFKPHPAEDWFGGIALETVMAGLPDAPNVRIAKKTWNNTDVMNAIDAIVTYHGTAGIEFAALGKPAMVPDKGKYDDCGFVRLAASRADYLATLPTRWWEGLDLAEAKRRAEIFSGWWFCAPAWQDGFVLPDDTGRYENYGHAMRLLDRYPAQVARELASLDEWWKSGHRYYHTWKMASADAYQLSNV
jgi:hypothetical protein